MRRSVAWRCRRRFKAYVQGTQTVVTALRQAQGERVGFRLW